MDRKGWYMGAKQKFEGILRKDFKIRSYYKSQEKLPPRLNLKGISIAARVLGHEIRNFTKNATGKDLARLRESETRQQVLTTLSELKVAVINKQSKYNLLTLACNHSANFTSSLSPEGMGGPDNISDFGENSLHEFIAKYHKQCLEQENKKIENSRKPFIKHKVSKRKILPDEEVTLEITCRCNSVFEEKRSRSSFLSCWEHKGIDEDQINSYYAENIPHFESDAKKYELNITAKDGWKEFLRNDKCVVFRKKLQNGLFEYRVQASFPDISANHLFTTQLDGEYRKTWDEYIIDLRVVDSHNASSSELVHWVTRCPYPFSTREYIYLRRNKVDHQNKALLLYQQATDQSDIPCEESIQRVDTYVSKIIIKPHQDDFNKMGCDFVLTYYDDPKMSLPQRILDMAASKGIADSVKRMHNAALELKTSTE